MRLGFEHLGHAAFSKAVQELVAAECEFHEKAELTSQYRS
jgi:hypothetical protein